MTLQQLTYFLATAEHGSFSRAARELYLAQPSLSEQVRSLEAGARRRAVRPRRPRRRAHRGRPGLPARGRTRARGAGRCARGRRRGARADRRHAQHRHVRHGLGLPPLAARRRLPLAASRASGCGSSARTRPRWPRTCAAAGSRRGSSCSRSTTKGSRSARQARGGRLRQPRAGARARAGHDRAARRAPLILYDAHYGWSDPTRRQLQERAQRAGVQLEPVIEIEDMDAALELAASGLGDTIAPKAALEHRPSFRRLGTGLVRRAALRRLRVHHPPRRAGVAAARAFLELAERRLAEFGEGVLYAGVAAERA